MLFPFLGQAISLPEILIGRGGAKWKKVCDIILVFFGGVVVMTSLKRRHSYILVIISLKTTIWPDHGTSGH